MMRQDTNPSFNFLALMALAGAVAAFGIVSDTIHVVVGAMLIAPGFDPLLRIVFGLLGNRQSVTSGLRSAASATLRSRSRRGSRPGGLVPQRHERERTGGGPLRIERSGVATSLLAGIAGGVIVSSRMKVLATGVMVALALVPSMALIGMSLAPLMPNWPWARPHARASTRFA